MLADLRPARSPGPRGRGSRRVGARTTARLHWSQTHTLIDVACDGSCGYASEGGCAGQCVGAVSFAVDEHAAPYLPDPLTPGGWARIDVSGCWTWSARAPIIGQITLSWAQLARVSERLTYGANRRGLDSDDFIAAELVHGGGELCWLQLWETSEDEIPQPVVALSEVWHLLPDGGLLPQ